MAIARTPWIDDDGSGTTGTVINNAEKTKLYDQIDGALAALPPAATIYKGAGTEQGAGVSSIVVVPVPNLTLADVVVVDLLVTMYGGTSVNVLQFEMYDQATGAGGSVLMRLDDLIAGVTPGPATPLGSFHLVVRSSTYDYSNVTATIVGGFFAAAGAAQGAVRFRATQMPANVSWSRPWYLSLRCSGVTGVVGAPPNGLSWSQIVQVIR